MSKLEWRKTSSINNDDFINKLDVTIALVDDRLEEESSSKISVRFGDEYSTKIKNISKELTRDLLMLLLQENFEYGIQSSAELLVKRQLLIDKYITRSWLNMLFVEQFDNPIILIGILHIIARIDYIDIYPEGQTMAVAALSHRDLEVKECAVRAFESWGTLESLKILENLKIETPWLKEYIDQVIFDLREEHNVVVGQKS